MAWKKATDAAKEQKEFKVEVKKVLKELSSTTNEKGEIWVKKLTLTSFNGKEPLYDIRGWYGDKMTKGVRLTEEEMNSLAEFFNEE